MTTWMHEQRLQAVLEVVRECGASSVLDLGCGDGDFLVRLALEPQIERISGIDSCAQSLERLQARLNMMHRQRMPHVVLTRGSMTDPDAPLAGFDCAVLIETIEHLPPDQLPALERNIFAQARPEIVIITTPNAEFNPLLGVPFHRHRRRDHHFEWDRDSFQRWTRGIAERHAYKVRHSDIAGRHPKFGGASQMAVFKVA